MARAVNATLVQILAEQGNVSNTDAERTLTEMKAENRYQVCCLHFPSLF